MVVANFAWATRLVGYLPSHIQIMLKPTCGITDKYPGGFFTTLVWISLVSSPIDRR